MTIDFSHGKTFQIDKISDEVFMDSTRTIARECIRYLIWVEFWSEMKRLESVFREISGVNNED